MCYVLYHSATLICELEFFLLKLPLDSLHFHNRYLLILLLNQLSTLRATIYRILFSYYQQISGLQGLILRLF